MAYRKQAVFGPFLVDFYLPDSQTIMEADGAYWHRNQQRDIDRDRLLLQMAPRNARIVHVHFYDPRFSPAPFDSNPLANVYYVACNPGPESYVDPERFQAVPLKRIRKWTYRKPTTRPGGRSACVYDITVEGVHSFVANGAVIANSFLEYGTHSERIVRPHDEGGVLSWVDRDGVRHFAKWVRIPPLAARPFMRPTAMQMQPQLRTLFSKPWELKIAS